MILPASVEQEETGMITVSVHNNSTTAIKHLQMTFSAPTGGIDYTQQNSNLLAFDTITAGEERFATLSYLVRSSGTQMLPTQVRITQNDPNLVTSREFSLQERVFPFMKYLLPIEVFLGIVTGFVAKPDLLTFITLVIQSLQKLATNK